MAGGVQLYSDRVAKTMSIPLPDGTDVPILYEDRSVLAVDKPAGWLVAPAEWKQTSRNLQRELMLSIEAREFWAASRQLRYVRNVHRLDAETSGILLLAKSPGAVAVLSKLFESRAVRKTYWAVVRGVPRQEEWTCQLKLADALDRDGRIRADQRHGREAVTEFKVLQRRPASALVEARPLTGRTHQIRVHLDAAGFPVAGDELYGGGAGPLALRAIELAYSDPFQKRPVRIAAPTVNFLQQFGFSENR